MRRAWSATDLVRPRTARPALEALQEAAHFEDEVRQFNRGRNRQRNDALRAVLVRNTDLEATRLDVQLECYDFVGIESHGRGIVAAPSEAPARDDNISRVRQRKKPREEGDPPGPRIERVQALEALNARGCIADRAALDERKPF